MSSFRRKSLFQKFFEHRSSLIMQYNNGDITKKEFLQYNFNFMGQLNCGPFTRIDSYEKGMYNYQYYNGMAKYYRMLAKEVRNTKKHNRYYNHYLNIGNNYYHEKDQSILGLLKFLNYENVCAYTIKVDSKALKDQLYEIVITDRKEAIFHSKALWLKEILREEGVFDEEVRTSKISEYINERY
ncbi:MAG: hypothetical protein Q4Q07_07830 [Tissierellia bacterium]|nr:hypothetical protein [Tissierellia bacterium]